MTIQRMDNVGIVVDDLDAAIAYFEELGMVLEGRAQIEGAWADQVTGLDGVRCDNAMLRTPDGTSRIELSKYLAPAPAAGPPDPPHNIVGTHRVMFTVDDLDEVIARLGKHGAEVVGAVARYGDSFRLCYVRGPAGILVGLAEEVS